MMKPATAPGQARAADRVRHARRPVPVHGAVVGVDTHQQTHYAVVLDPAGRLLATAQFPASPAGYADLSQWAARHAAKTGEAGIAAFGIESTGSYGAGLVRHLLATTDGGADIKEVVRPDRQTRAMHGKSDAIDAEAAARAVLAGTAAGRPKITTGVVEAIRNLTVARASAVRDRTSALSQLRDLATTAPDVLRDRLLPLTARARVDAAAALRPDPARLGETEHAARHAMRALARRIRHLDTEVADLDSALEPLVAQTAPRLLALPQVGVHTAAQLLITAGENIDRLGSEASFARLVGAAPIPASSGKTHRHRLDRGGDRQANKALYMLVIRRLRTDERTRAYRDRRSQEPRMTTKAIIRCLKRYAAREIYYALRADLLESA